MTSILHFTHPFFSQKKTPSLAESTLRAHDNAGKQEALDAIDILVKYKSNVHEFTDEIINHWSMPRRIMERYEIDDAEQLNEWLDGF